MKCAAYISAGAAAHRGRRLPRPGRRCYAFVLPESLAFEQVFVRTCVLMTVDARGVLWIDNPLLVLGLLSLLWVLIASLHSDPWLRWHGDVRQLGQRALDRFVWIRVVLQRASQVGVVRAHVKVAVARQIEQNYAPLARFTGTQRFVDGRANG